MLTPFIIRVGTHGTIHQSFVTKYFDLDIPQSQILTLTKTIALGAIGFLTFMVLSHTFLKRSTHLGETQQYTPGNLPPCSWCQCLSGQQVIATQLKAIHQLELLIPPTKRNTEISTSQTYKSMSEVDNKTYLVKTKVKMKYHKPQ